MRILAVACNVVLFGFTCLVLVTDGPPQGTGYTVFTLWSLSTLVLSSMVISHGGASDSWLVRQVTRRSLDEQKKNGNVTFPSTVTGGVAIIANIIFLGFICWALVDQYPHPDEEGFIAFIALMIFTPILNLVVLLGGRNKALHGQPTTMAPQ